MPEKPYYLLEIRLETKDLRQGYDELYSEASLSQIESFYKWLIKKMNLPTHGRLLDLACGAGEMVRLTGQRGMQSIGLDISEVVAHATAQQVRPHGWLGVSRGEEIPFAENSFDCITNIGSLEHFEDPAQGVREMSRVLKANGKAYILVPNTFSILVNVWNAFRKGITSVDQQPIQRYGARMDWVNLLESNGLKVIKTLKYERAWPQSFSDVKFYLSHPKELIRILATPLLPLNLAFCFIFICKKDSPKQ